MVIVVIACYKLLNLEFKTTALEESVLFKLITITEIYMRTFLHEGGYMYH